MTMKMSNYRRFLYEDFTLGLAVPIVVFNATELIHIIRGKHRRKNIYKATLLVASLCVSDLLLGINMIVLKTMHRYMATHLKNNAHAQHTYDVIRFGCIRLSFFLSTLNLAAITYDRYAAITNPFVHRTRGKEFFMRMIAAIWVAAIIITVLMYLLFSIFLDKDGKSYMNLLFPIPTFSVLILFVYCYVNIYFSVKHLKMKVSMKVNSSSMFSHTGKWSGAKSGDVWRTSTLQETIPEEKDGEKAGIIMERIRATDSPEGASDIFVVTKDNDQSSKSIHKQDTEKSDSRKRVFSRDKKVEHRLLKLAIANVSLFLLCWCPLAISCCMVVSKVEFSKDIFSSFFVLANMNALVNPIAYYFNARRMKTY